MLKLGSFQMLTVSIALAMGMTGCGRSESPSTVDGSRLTKVVLQTDWFPQPEHGGFYQALAMGYYEEAGLDVKILPGGPNSMSTQKVLKGRAHFAMNRADTIYSLASREVSIVMVMATLQHDPQALMLHASNPIESFKDLEGETIMAIPGLAWIRWIEAKYDIRLNIIPHDFGIERFLNDTTFIQQCLLTNEPYYVKQAGVKAKVMPLRESGFDPYHGIYCLNELALENPDLVSRFVAASVRGWKDYILNDPEPAFSRISELNPKMNQAFMSYSYHAMREGALITGEDSSGTKVGSIDPSRMEAMADEMHQLGLVEEPAKPGLPWYTTRFLVKPEDEPANGLP